MLLFLSVLIPLSSFNCNFQAFSTLVAGTILSFPWRVQLPLLFTGISLGLNLNFSWDTDSHIPQIIPPSIPLLLNQSRKEKITCILSPRKVYSSPLKIDATHTSNSRKKYCRFTGLSSAPSCFLAVLVVPHRHTTSLSLSPGLIIWSPGGISL